MGGFGSGKCYWKRRPKRSSKLFTSSLYKLCIPHLLKEHKKTPGVFIWNDQIRLIVEDDSILFSSIDGQQMNTEIVKMTKMPCHYGGFRFFGLCPCCSKQVRDLYFYKTTFACRHCFRMTYYTRHTTLSRRLILKREKISKRINDDTWNKPKWMRQKTFARVRSEYFDLDEKELIADFYSLRTNYAVDKLFAKYGCAIAAAEALETKFC